MVTTVEEYLFYSKYMCLQKCTSSVPVTKKYNLHFLVWFCTQKVSLSPAPPKLTGSRHSHTNSRFGYWNFTIHKFNCIDALSTEQKSGVASSQSVVNI